MKKWINIIYGSLFLAFLLLPFVTINVEKDQISSVDNEKLPEIEGEFWDLPVTLDNYVNKRIGFRKESLDLYQYLNTKLFNYMDHPLYMYGKDGHVFYHGETYLSDYQHTNLDPEWAKGFALTLQHISNITRTYDSELIYMLIPDKKTVYPEYFFPSVNIKGDYSRTDLVIDELSKTTVNWMYFGDTMINAKNRFLVNNVIYDPVHWNENGAFICYQELYERIRLIHPELNPLDINDYIVDKKIEDAQIISEYKIYDEVPRYTLKNDSSINDIKWLKENVEFQDETLEHNRYINPNASSNLKLLVYHDSYMVDHMKFFTENFSEVTFIRRSNPLDFALYKSYLETLSPDIVILENPERMYPMWFENVD